MAAKGEAISVRTSRLNGIILGSGEAANKVGKGVAEGLHRENLLDAITLLYGECQKEHVKKNDKNINDFVSKYRPIIEETKTMRVNLNDFVVKDLIGKGYFGEVNLVKEKSTNDIYAMKRIKKAGITTSQVREERDIMAMHKSEWITSLQYAFQDSDFLYLVMEYLPGGDLLSLMIRNGAFDEELARFYLAQLTEALNALHNMGYVHRDVKPENILLDRCGHLKLADFGNAAMLNKDGSVISLSPVGTPDYIAPELLQTLSTIKITKSVHDVTCDFWSMGIIGYELVTEVTPFHEENVHETYSKILCHSDETINHHKLEYPSHIKVSPEFKHLIDHLVTNADKRFTYKKIVKHPFFKDVNWSTLRDQVPPIIPTVTSEDDTSNFEDFEKKGRRSTFLKKPITPHKRNEFSGENFPFLGYSFVHQERSLVDPTIDNQLLKLQSKLKDLNKTIIEQNIEIKTLQRDLTAKEKRVAEMSSSDKMAQEKKMEIAHLKEVLKEKTLELVACKTEIKTLKSSLKIEEEQRLKSDNSIAEVLQSTYRKWEKAKHQSELNYEKEIAEKKREIRQLNEKLLTNESELKSRLTECGHLQETLNNYKEMLKKSKDHSSSDRVEFEKGKKELIDSYEQKIADLKEKIKLEKQEKQKEVNSLSKVRHELNESICSRQSISDAKRSSDKTVLEMKTRINQQFEENRILREAKIAADKALSELQRKYDELSEQMVKMEELQEQQVASNRSSFNEELQFRSAKGSWQDLNAALLEEQLRNDLLMAKENEIKQRKRADDLEKMKERLEDAISKLEDNTAGGLLEKQNSRLEDQLKKAREDAIVERQAARAANLSVWKLEKQIDELTAEKKLSSRRVELMEQKCAKLKEEKQEFDGKIKINGEVIASKDREIVKLQKEIDQLKDSVKKENDLWKQSEQERMKEKREIIEHISKIQKLEDLIEEGKRRLLSLQQKSESLAFENKRLINERDLEQSEMCQVSDSLQDVQVKYENLSHNYNMLKEACNITEVQLTEMENLLEKEMKRNSQAKAQIEDLLGKIKDKDSEMGKLRGELADELNLKKALEHKYQQAQVDLIDAKDQLQKVATDLTSNQESLIDKTSNLFNIQEKLEVLHLETNNLQQSNDHYSREIDILKEENTKILTEYYDERERNQKINHDLKIAQTELHEQKQEIDHLNQILSEQKNYYVQRDIKSEATLAQHKKLIDYLQQKVEELSNKKKKSLVEKIFGSHDNAEPVKKENIPPVITDTLPYKKMQEDLRRERCRNNQLKEKLLRTKSELIRHQPSAPPMEETTRASDSTISVPKKEEEKFVKNEIGWSFKNASKNVKSSESSDSGTDKNSDSHHHFELTLESPSASNQLINCIACQRPVLTTNTFLRCKECRLTIHRKCRAAITSNCNGFEPVALSTTGPSMETIDDVDGKNFVTTATIETSRKDYGGDFLFRPTELSPPVFVNCVYEINSEFVLVGCETGLYSYHYGSRNLVHIQGLDCVNYIEINKTINKAIIIAANQESLYQCDVRHLMTRGQAAASSKPKLEAQILDLPFANRNSNERWHLVKINGDQDSVNDVIAIAATSSRIVIMKFDQTKNIFKPVRALDTATPISNILFTQHTALVSSDKFFEIDLGTYTAEEFVDISQPTSGLLKNCRPMASFRINKNEFLLCFEEFGIYVDEYGCRSRTQEIDWTYTPTGFMFCNGILFICHFNMVQIMRIYRCPVHELSINYEDDESQIDGSSIENIKAFIPLSRPKLLNSSGKLNVFALVTLSETDKQEVIVIDGMKSLRAMMSASVETLASSSNFASSRSSFESAISSQDPQQ